MDGGIRGGKPLAGGGVELVAGTARLDDVLGNDIR